MSMISPFEGSPSNVTSLQSKRRNVPPSLPPFEMQQRQELIARWRKRQIIWNQNENGGRISPSAEDIERYRARKKGHEGMGMYGSEDAAFAEYMVLELLDSTGVTGQKLSLFGESAHAYEPSDIDDVLSGADAIVLYVDPEEELRGAPVIVDVTTDRAKLQDKQFKDFGSLRRGMSGEPFSQVYWYDAKAEEPEMGFTEPSEGKVIGVNTSIYVPSEYTKRFLDPSVSGKAARHDMNKLGSFIVTQQQLQLESLAIAALRRVNSEDIKRGRLDMHGIRTRQDLKRLLREAKAAESVDSGKFQVLQTFEIALVNVWEVKDRREEKGLVCDPRDFESLRQAVLASGFEGLAADEESLSAKSG